MGTNDYQLGHEAGRAGLSPSAAASVTFRQGHVRAVTEMAAEAGAAIAVICSATKCVCGLTNYGQRMGCACNKTIEDSPTIEWGGLTWQGPSTEPRFVSTNELELLSKEIPVVSIDTGVAIPFVHNRDMQGQKS